MENKPKVLIIGVSVCWDITYNMLFVLDYGRIMLYRHILRRCFCSRGIIYGIKCVYVIDFRRIIGIWKCGNVLKSKSLRNNGLFECVVP